MRQRFSNSRLPLGMLLSALMLTGCASVNKLAWNPFGDRIKDRENRFSFAQVTERNGDIYRAETSYRQLTEEVPKDARYCQRLGVVLVRQGKLEEGITVLNKARDLDDDNIAILNDLGYAYTVQGEYEQAEKVLRDAMKIDPREVRTQNNLAMALGYMGKSEESYEMFRRNTDEGTARNNLAYIYAQTGHVDLAVKEYSKALSHSPDNKAAAEAILQLNTLQQSLAAKAKSSEPKVQLASDAVQSPAVSRKEADRKTAASKDLVQLVGDVEVEDADVVEGKSSQAVGRASYKTISAHNEK